jgi:hypothetical protein
MYVARLIIVLFLTLAIVVSYSPQVRREVSHAWEDVRPAVIEIMDGLYANIRDFVAGIDSKDRIDDNAPGVDFELITTMDWMGSSKM